jgi:hypothetical protein
MKRRDAIKAAVGSVLGLAMAPLAKFLPAKKLPMCSRLPAMIMIDMPEGFVVPPEFSGALKDLREHRLLYYYTVKFPATLEECAQQRGVKLHA